MVCTIRTSDVGFSHRTWFELPGTAGEGFARARGDLHKHLLVGEGLDGPGRGRSGQAAVVMGGSEAGCRSGVDGRYKRCFQEKRRNPSQGTKDPKKR